MIFLDDGNIDYSVNDLINLMKSNIDINNVFSSSNKYTNEFNSQMKLFENTSFDFSKHNIDHKHNQNEWFIPDEYLEINIYEFLINKCSNDIQKERVIYELEIYKKYNLENLLKFIIFLVDLMRDSDIVWGVGRGSSTCSYILFLIGIHKIDSLKYDLDFNEFLK